MLISSRYFGFVTLNPLSWCSSFMELGLGPAASFPQQMLRRRFCSNESRSHFRGIRTSVPSVLLGYFSPSLCSGSVFPHLKASGNLAERVLATIWNHFGSFQLF